MRLEDMVSQAQDAISVRRVFGEPYLHDGAMVIPVASIAAGAGGGSGSDGERGAHGEGGGFGATGRPIGAYVIRDGRVSWRPAVDVNAAILRAGVALTALLHLLARAQRRRAMR
jgi:uncharacterized spore protein YtfJ